MRKFLSILMATLLAIALLAGCGGTASSSGRPEPSSAASSSTSPSGGEKLKVVATIFPQYDFVREIAGDKVELTMLLPPGAESHSYEPTPQDIITIQDCDVFIYVGGDSDTWIEDILASMDTSNMKIVSLMDCVDVVEEEIVEGMQDEEEGHSHGSEEFEDADVQERPLSDWDGEWQSTYPYLLDGTLDEYLAYKAENDEDETHDAAYYRDKYNTAYETDADKVVIDGDAITYYVDGEPNEVTYESKGFEIVLNKSGEKRVRYLFEATGETSGAPKYVQFSDHIIEPGQDIEHFHMYVSDVSNEALLDEWDHWPTYYPASLTGDEICNELMGHDAEPEFDEHVWTSPKNAELIVQKLSDTLCEADSANADAYRQNATAYLDELALLDAAFQDVVDNAVRKTMVFGDRFPFRYFADAYGLDYYAAFPGCSTETEPSAATVAFLIDKVNEEQIPVVFHIELSNEKMADTICAETGAEKQLFHACHNVTQAEMDNGATYLSLMTGNVEALKEALQ